MPGFLSIWILIALGSSHNSTIALHQIGGQTLGLPGCSASGFKCDEVSSSLYGRVFGISLAWWGLAHYLALAVILAVVRHWLEIPAKLLVVVDAVPGAAAAAWLIVLMKLQLGIFCFWSLAVHGVNVALFLAAVYQAQAAWDRRLNAAKSKGEPPPKDNLVWACLGASLLLAG